MSYGLHRFIDPVALAAVADLSLVARRVVEGFMFGEHRSTLSGAGLEFSQYRSYQPGDDLRRLDWKLLARSDRYYIREAEAETAISVRFLIDCSRSMLHAENVPKFDYARFLVAALAYLASQQGDAVGLLSVSSEGASQLSPRAGQQHLHRLLHHLDDLQPTGRWPDWSELEGTLTAATRRELIVAVSDLHERADEITDSLVQIRHLGNDVQLIHLLGPRELDLEYDGPVELEDLETGAVVEVDPRTSAAAYRREMRGRIDDVRRLLGEEDIAYHLAVTNEPLDTTLREFLRVRSGSVLWR